MESPDAAGETGAVPLLVPRPKRKGLILKHNQVDTKGGMLDAFISTPPPKPENDQVAAASVSVPATSDEGPEMPLKTEVKKVELHCEKMFYKCALQCDEFLCSESSLFL